MSRSPTRGNPLPVTAKEVQKVPQPPIASVRRAVGVNNLQPPAPNNISNKKSFDLISLRPNCRVAERRSAGYFNDDEGQN